MKIGFLAMSGVRVHDKHLIELGLTLPGFVERSKVVASLPSLGLLYLAACTPDGHELRYIESEDGEAGILQLEQCDLVAISTFTAQVRDAYTIADRLRGAGVLVAMGGLHVSVQPDEARLHADHVIIGEGENVWPEVVRAAERGEAGRMWRAAEYPPVNVGSLPVPRYDLLRNRDYNRITVQTSRGCPWRCHFCASNVMLGNPYRKRPVAHVVRDIEAAIAAHGQPFIEFADDNTFVDKKWSKSLVRAITPLGIKWFTETDISVADDEELLALLADSGCRQLLIGLESPTGSALDGVELRANFKQGRFERYAHAVRLIQSHGITVNGCFVIGLDGHGPEIFEAVERFVNELSLYEVQITVLTPFPGTPLYATLLKEHRILEEHAWHLCTLFDVNFVPARMSPDELRAGLYRLTESLYDPENVQRRRREFFRGLRDRSRDERAETFPRMPRAA